MGKSISLFVTEGTEDGLGKHSADESGETPLARGIGFKPPGYTGGRLFRPGPGGTVEPVSDRSPKSERTVSRRITTPSFK